MRKTWKWGSQILIDYFFITVGSFIMAVGIGVFLVDAQVVPGGVSGLSMAIHYLSGGKIPVGFMMWVFNVPLFIWGIKELGSSFGFRTFYGFTVNSFFIDFLRGEVPGFRMIQWQNSETVQYLLKNDFFFLILLGATFLGIGLGMIFKFKGTTAGSDIVAAIAQKKIGWKPGQTIMLTDFFVISFAGMVIHLKHLSPDRPALALTLYAFFLLFLSARLIDIILDGFDYAKSAFIISDKSQEIGDKILATLSRGATAFHGKGLYRGVERDIIYTVIDRKEVSRLRDIVQQIDPGAFVIIENVHEVLGEGFRRRDSVQIPEVLKKLKNKKSKITPPHPSQEWE